MYIIATMATHFEDLCKYIGLPSNLCLLFDAEEGGLQNDETASSIISGFARK